MGLALVALLGILLVAARIWTEYLWFQEVAYEKVFYTRIWAWALAALAGALLFLAIFLPNLYLARRLSPRIRISANRADDVVVELVPIGDRTVLRLILGVSLVLAFFFALTAGSLWQELLLFLNQASFVFADPIFNRDASFYVFTLPVMSSVHAFIWAALVLALAGTIAVYVFDRAILVKEGERGVFFAPHVKAHLSVLAALALVLKAGGYMIDAWKLNYSSRGVVFGGSYADIHAELPVIYILAVVALVSALIFLGNIYYRGWRLPVAAVGLLVLVWIVAGQIYPAIVQQYRVSPNEVVAESPYIEDNIAATRFAFGLDRVTSRPFPAEQTLTSGDLQRNEDTIGNIRLWDPPQLLQNYNQLQAIRLYYTFRDVDVDRYEIDGNYRQIMLSAREMDQNALQAQARTWVNQHLTYTHGYGLVVSPVNETTAEGLPPLLVRDIPPRTDTDLAITRPEIYYGEMGNEYVLVNTEANEFDFPQGDQNVFSNYEGEGGVEVHSFLRSAAFAVRFGTIKLFVSDYLTDESRIMYHRTIQERVRKVAPFLDFDRDPYLFIRDDGSLAWIWDAYTTTGGFPYSQPRANGLNYIRNSVKAVVDAYSGGITLYQIDADDALANAWGKVYPGILTPSDEMPEDLRRHLRYPEDLFRIQAEVLSTYHMLDAQTFYNKEDVWAIPNEFYANQEVPMMPYYVIMGLPGEQQEEMLLMQPYTPSQKLNMVAWMAARMDGDNYGELVIFEFPKQSLVFGPSQIEARISNDPEISEQVTLWDQAGSNVIRGNLLVIPLEDAVIYVEPLYLQADTSPIPELRRVIASYGNRVAMEPSLEEALQALFEPGAERPGTVTTQPGDGQTTTTAGATTTTEPGATTTTTEPGTTTTTEPGTTTATTTDGGELPTDRLALTALAQQHYGAALEAQRSGDWSEYGRRIEELGRVLRALEALQ